MSMLTSMSGYPEWLPEDRLAEQALVRLIQSRFELFGFAPIETRAAEPLSTLLTKGETDKEIYVLRRLQEPGSELKKSIGLHFDLTVPFGRYVIENSSKLVFPLRRYQIQKAWRGERPGLGRYREFLQADIDIVDEESLTIYSDLEVIQTINEVMASMPIPEVQILINNRKILEGFYRALGILEITEVLRVVDKLEKIGEANVFQQLVENIGLSADQARKCIEIGKINGRDIDTIVQAIRSFDVDDGLLDEGLYELGYILSACNRQAKSSVYADLSIARGLDYYTGTVCEGKFKQFPKYPTIVAGGRYDSLISDHSLRLPGVGVSIGITRILGLVLHEGFLKANRKTPSCVLIALISDEMRDKSTEIASILRTRSIPCEVFSRPVKYGKQIRYAARKGIPYVWFPSDDGQCDGEVRDIRTGKQFAADVVTWTPGTEDLQVKIAKDEAVLQELLKNETYC